MKIMIASEIDSEALDYLGKQHDLICAINASDGELKDRIRDREVLIFRSGVDISADVMSCGPELKILVRAGSGLDNVDVDYARQRGLQLFRVPGPGARAVAEMTFALILALARRVAQADRLWRRGHWAKYELAGHLLLGKTLGVVGMGSIGTEVGKLGSAMGMRVIGCVEHPSPERAQRFLDKGLVLTGFDEVVAQADFLSIHVPLKESTYHLINEEVLSRSKPNSFLVNIARGGVVDELALREALTGGGRISGAALDVHEAEGEGKISPLAPLDNVILTPHIGAMAIDSQREIGRSIVELLHLVAAGHRPGLLSVVQVC